MKNNFNSYKTFFAFFCATSIIFYGVANSLSRFIPYTKTTSKNYDTPICVVIDPGHGGEDGGASTYGAVTEKELNLSIGLTLRDMLEFCGIKVVMTRSDDRLLYDINSDYKGKKKTQDLYNRLRIARSVPNGILISIHMNAFPEEKYSGLQVYYSQNTKLSLKLANLIQDNAKTVLSPQNNRKTKQSDNKIYLLDRYEGVGILVECGFMSNPREYALLCSSQYQRKLSLMLLASLTQFIATNKI